MSEGIGRRTRRSICHTVFLVSPSQRRLAVRSYITHSHARPSLCWRIFRGHHTGLLDIALRSFCRNVFVCHARRWTTQVGRGSCCLSKYTVANKFGKRKCKCKWGKTRNLFTRSYQTTRQPEKSSTSQINPMTSLTTTIISQIILHHGGQPSLSR